MNWNKFGTVGKIIACITVCVIAGTRAEKCFDQIFNNR
ncbi:hypothetical protein HDG36_002686 [Paraburkholderia sp. Kb1A]|nr:hypothetical protein [Paraburkholderia sp. Kb1A]